MSDITDNSQYTDCPNCEGYKTVPGPCVHYGNLIITTTIKCPFCEGLGAVTIERAQAWDAATYWE